MNSILILLLISTSLAAPPMLPLVEPSESVEPDHIGEISDVKVTDENTNKKISGANFLEKHQKFLSWLDFFDEASQVPEEPPVEVLEEAIEADASDEESGNRQKQSAVRGSMGGMSENDRLDFLMHMFWHGIHPKFCPVEELDDLIGDDFLNLDVKTATLPGRRCFTDDLFHPGRCIEPTCLAVKVCGTKGHDIVGTCKVGNRYDQNQNFLGLCCMPPK